MQTNPCRRGTQWLLLVLPLTFTALVYHPITGNYFFADDFLNLYGIVNHEPVRYLLTPNGGHLLVTRNAVFYATFKLFATRPEYYFWVVLLTHLVNVWLVFRVIRVFTQSPRLASFGAALWGTCPLNEGSLGWYSVYGHVLVGTALLIILDQAGRLSSAAAAPSRRRRACWYVLALLGATSFGTGIGVALVLPFVLALLLPVPASGGPRRLVLVTLPLTTVVLYALLPHVYIYVSGDTFPTLTHWVDLAQTLFRHLPSVFLIWLRLVGIGVARLLLGYFPGPALEAGVSYGAVGVLALLVTLAMSTSPTRFRRRIAACLLLLVACYGMIVVGRSIAFAIRPNLIERAYRYHYTAQIALTILLCLVLQRLDLVRKNVSKNVLLAVWYAATAFTYARYGVQIDHHDTARAETQHVLSEIRESVRQQPPTAGVYISNRRFKALPFSPRAFPGWAAVFVVFHRNDVVDGSRVYFVEKNVEVVEATKDGRRTAGLLVPPRSGL